MNNDQSPLCGLRWLTVWPVSSCLGKGSARTVAVALVAVASALLGRAIPLDRTACDVVIVLGAARHDLGGPEILTSCGAIKAVRIVS